MAAALLTVCVSQVAYAEQFYLTVNIECDTKHSRLSIRFDGAWNAEGERAIESLGPGGIDPWSLISFTQKPDGRYDMDIAPTTRLCSLKGSLYTIEVNPFMGPGFHPEGLCATRMGASVVVKSDGKTVAIEGVDACTETGVVVKRIVITPRRPPVYERIDAGKFFHPK